MLFHVYELSSMFNHYLPDGKWNKLGEFRLTRTSETNILHKTKLTGSSHLKTCMCTSSY